MMQRSLTHLKFIKKFSRTPIIFQHNSNRYFSQNVILRNEKTEESEKPAAKIEKSEKPADKIEKPKTRNPREFTSFFRFNTLIKQLIKQGELDNAVELFRSMKTQDTLINATTFNLIINEYERRGEKEKADELRNEMAEMNISPKKTNLMTFFEGPIVKKFIGTDKH